jgi:hypothetical protein
MLGWTWSERITTKFLHNEGIYMPMGQFRANIFLILITSTYFWASEVFKNQRF